MSGQNGSTCLLRACKRLGARARLCKKQTTTAQENQTVAEQARHTLEDVIHASIKQELAEISNNIAQSVREIVKEIAPKIVREIVKEEIDKIKNS